MQNRRLNPDLVASIQIKATWTHENNTQDDTNDPPPTPVWVVENSGAGWAGLVQGLSGGGNYAVSRPGGGLRSAGAAPSSDVINAGSASDGLGDPEVKSPASGPPYVSGSSVPTNAQNLAPPPTGWHKYSVQGDQIIFTGMPRSLSADATAAGQIPGEVGVKCALGPYTITIHATPYNFHRVVGGGNIGFDGTLSFTYDWLSTTGNKDNLTSCFWHEYVTYDGPVGTAANPNKFYPQNPPFNFIPGVSWLNNPYVNPGTGNHGGAMTGTN